MTGWSIVSVIIALCGLAFTAIGITEKITKPLRESIKEAVTEIKHNTETINKFSTDITSLSIKLEDDERDYARYKEKISERHKKIFDNLDEHEKQIISHENRISNLEKEKTL